MGKVKPMSKDTQVSKRTAYADFRGVVKMAWKLAEMF